MSGSSVTGLRPSVRSGRRPPAASSTRAIGSRARIHRRPLARRRRAAERGASPRPAAPRAGGHDGHRQSGRRRPGQSRRAARRARGRASGTEVGLLIGHGSVRQRGHEEREPRADADELQKMKDLVRRGMEEGAFGLSSRTVLRAGQLREDRGSDRAREGRRGIGRPLHQPHPRRGELRQRRPRRRCAR